MLNFVELIKKYWFYSLIGVIFVIFILYRELAIWFTIIFLIIFLVFYLPSFSPKSRLIRDMKKHKAIEDRLVAQKLDRSLEEVKEKMDQLATKQKGKKWLIVSMNNRYVFYNGETIEKFKDFYKMGFNEKRIFDNLRKDVKIRTRAEIKAIEDLLISLKRIKKREPAAKEITVSKKKPAVKKPAVSKEKPAAKKIAISKIKPAAKKPAVSKKKPAAKPTAVSKKKPPTKRIPESKKKPAVKKPAVSEKKPPSKDKSKRSPRDK